MKEIPLSKGKHKTYKNTGKYVAIVDEEDFEYLNQFSWCVRAKPEKCNNVYAQRRAIVNGKITSIQMHREIMGVTDSNILVDHKDRNGLNCQRSNLRICTHAQNVTNRASATSGKSKYLGVHKVKNKSLWKAQISKDYKQFYLGHFKKEEDAARAYDTKAKELHGEFANLNFPEINHLEMT